MKMTSKLFLTKRVPAYRACGVFLLLTARSVTGQQPPTPRPPDAPVKIQVTVNAVLIPVVVRDAQDHVVGNLKKEEFQVFDKDRPRDITGFTVETRAATTPFHEPGPATSGNSPGVGIPSEISTGRPTERSIVFLFDDLHLTPGDLSQVQSAAVKMIPSTLAETDMAAVVSFTGTYSGITRDPAKLQEFVRKLKSHNLYGHTVRECPDVDYFRADQIQNKQSSVALESAVQDTLACANLDPRTMRNMAESMARSAASRALNIGDQDVRVTLSFLKELIYKMKALPGQRTLILVSPGFLAITPEAMAAKAQIIDFAAQNNVTINSLGATGLYTTSLDAGQRGGGSAYELATGTEAQAHRESLSQNEDVMAELADGTGGTYFHNSNDLAGGLKSLTVAPEFLYLLEIPLDDVKPDGSYHRLKVKVAIKGAKVQSRRGYFAPAPTKAKK